MLNFDADVKDTTARHQWEKPLETARKQRTIEVFIGPPTRSSALTRSTCHAPLSRREPNLPTQVHRDRGAAAASRLDDGVGSATSRRPGDISLRVPLHVIQEPRCYVGESRDTGVQQRGGDQCTGESGRGPVYW